MQLFHGEILFQMPVEFSAHFSSGENRPENRRRAVEVENLIASRNHLLLDIIADASGIS
jgi:hypothetical protein